jgi:hypothetical protein
MTLILTRPRCSACAGRSTARQGRLPSRCLPTSAAAVLASERVHRKSCSRGTAGRSCAPKGQSPLPELPDAGANPPLARVVISEAAGAEGPVLLRRGSMSRNRPLTVSLEPFRVFRRRILHRRRKIAVLMGFQPSDQATDRRRYGGSSLLTYAWAIGGDVGPPMPFGVPTSRLRNSDPADSFIFDPKGKMGSNG